MSEFSLSPAVSEAEVLRLSEAMTRLTQQLQEERESHAATSRSLHATAEEGRTQVGLWNILPVTMLALSVCECVCVCVCVCVCAGCRVGAVSAGVPGRGV